MRLIDDGKLRDIVACGDGQNDAVIFTDGWVPDPRAWVTDDSCLDGAAGRIGAAMFHKSLAKPLCFDMDVPVEWKWAWEERGAQIVLVELLAPLIALYTWKTFLHGRTCIFFNDSTTAESMLVKGYSNAAVDANAVIAEFWHLACDVEICAYIDRVPTDCNPSDGCSRGSTFVDAPTHGWEQCRPLVKETWVERGPGSAFREG